VPANGCLRANALRSGRLLKKSIPTVPAEEGMTAYREF
jgi:hypothetical protein